ncbi:MAG: AI-2E family transporter [Thermoleophilia bacterium]|nr:AI-2E family transporter [Thermoleophilia bacterium]
MTALRGPESMVERALPIYLALLFAILTVIALLVLRELGHVLLLLFVSVLLAAAMSRPAEWLARFRVPRALAVVAIYLTVVAAVAALAWFVVPPLFGQVATLGDRAPEYAERYDALRTTYEGLRDDYPALPSFDAQVERLRDRIVSDAGDRVVGLPGRLFSVLLDALAVLVISLLLVTNRRRLLDFGLSLVHPSDRALVAALLAKMGSRLGAYVRAKLIVMAIIGALHYLALLVLGVPFAILLAILVAFAELIPRVGPWLGRIPLLAVAALEGLATLGLTFAASIVIQNLKGYVISPLVEGEQLDIHPLLVFVAVLVGAALGGVAGAFIAVPVAAILQTLVEDVIVPWRRRDLAPAETPAPQA